MALVMFSSCILWQYILMVLIPTLGSSDRVAHKLTGEKDEHLIRGVVVVGDQHGEVGPPGTALAGLVPELTLELVQRLVQLVLGHQIPSVVAQLHENTPEGGIGELKVVVFLLKGFANVIGGDSKTQQSSFSELKMCSRKLNKDRLQPTCMIVFRIFHNLYVSSSSSIVRERKTFKKKKRKDKMIAGLQSAEWQQEDEQAAAQDPKTATSIYDFSATDIDGNVVSLEKYRTPVNYSQFAEMHAKYSERGLHILAFPSNQFGNQVEKKKSTFTFDLRVPTEPGTDTQIKAFAASYNARFDMFSKIDVNGDNAHPLWKWLKEQPNGGGFLGNRIKWNFTKFLINREGQVVKRYGPLDDPIVSRKYDRPTLSQADSFLDHDIRYHSLIKSGPLHCPLHTLGYTWSPFSTLVGGPSFGSALCFSEMRLVAELIVRCRAAKVPKSKNKASPPRITSDGHQIVGLCSE
ncbi:Phospholipid hydroperoxide glutathione peroxidase [Merluccius polli]|uniref:Glutathione peroxidase n=1 Tax=Merluccius polli TaxID=89951 RepID=A0AA47P9Q5_MERPO|nr:Phospholipid hydroperoxide glutathione peroxidase [Merluccius polli]